MFICTFGHMCRGVGFLEEGYCLSGGKAVGRRPSIHI